MAKLVRYYFRKLGANFVDFSLDYPNNNLSIIGTDVIYVGSSGVDRVYVAKGVKFTFNNSGTGTDEIYLGGSFADYSLTANGTSTLVLTSAAKANTTITLASEDKVFFSDGSKTVMQLITYARDRAANASTPVLTFSATEALETSLTLPSTSNLDSILRAYTKDPSGVVFAQPHAGVEFILTGHNGIDKVYVSKGGKVNANNLGTGVDLIYLTSNKSDYSATATGTSVLVLTRGTERVTLASEDRVIFADGSTLVRDAITAVANWQALTLDTNTNAPKPTTQVNSQSALNLSASQHQYVVLPQEAAAISGDLTLEAWVYVRATPGNWSRFFDFNNKAGLSNNVILGLPDGKLGFSVFSGGVIKGEIIASALFPTDSWHHVAVTVGGANALEVNLYIDGVSVKTGNLTAAVPTIDRSYAFVGHSNVGADPDFNGSIRDVRIYDNTRTNISSDMNGTPDTTDSSLKGYYPFTTSYASGKSGLIAGAAFGNPTFAIADLRLSNDAGAVGDFITNAAAQQITGRLTAPLAAGESLWLSLDDGSTWSNVTSNVSGTTVLTYPVNLLTGTHNLEFAVRNAAGSQGPVAVQSYTLDTALDVTPPTAYFPDRTGLKTQSGKYATLPKEAVAVSGDLTIEAWVYADGVQGNWTPIFDLEDGKFLQNNIRLFIYEGQLVLEATSSSTFIFYQYMGAFPTNAWHHVAIQIGLASRSVNVFVDGSISRGGLTLTGDIPAVERRNSHLGHDNNGGPDFKGYFRDVRIYDKALSNEQILADMAGGTENLSNSDLQPKGYYPFTTSGTSGLSGVPNATLTGSPIFSNPNLAFLSDTGTAGDYKTTVSANIIYANLNGTLAAGETLWGSLDDGVTWKDVTSMFSDQLLAWNGANLLPGTHTLELQVRDAAQNRGPLLTQEYTVL